MKNIPSMLVVCGVAICVATAGRAQSSTPAASDTPAATGTEQATEDFSNFKTADALWAEIEKMEQGTGDQTDSADAVMALLQRLTSAAAEYENRYPKDPRRWEAKLVELRFGSMLQQSKGE